MEQDASTIALLINAQNEVITSEENRKASASAKEQASGRFVRLFIKAILGGQKDEARKALGAEAEAKSPAKAKWDAVKGRASDAEFILRYLKAGNVIPAPETKGVRTPWIINSNEVATLTRAHILHLHAPQDKDTGIRTLINAARKREKEFAAKDTARRDADNNALSAFIAAHPDDWAGDDPTSVREILRDKPEEIARFIREGNDLIRIKRETEERASVETAKLNAFNAFLTSVPTLSDEQIEDALKALELRLSRNAQALAQAA